MTDEELIKKLTNLRTEIDNIITSVNLDIIDTPVEEPEPEPTPVSTTREPIKRALIVGVNKYDPSLGCDLNGCVNDANNIRRTLANTFNFGKSNITMLTDYNATKDNIISGLNDLISDVVEGDQLVFYFSGHGSQVPDTNGDEPDRMDEILCPTDLDWNDPFTDDILAGIFKQVPVCAQLTFLCDSCHSGTVSRVSLPRGNGRARYLDPPLEVVESALGRDLPVNKIGQKALVGVSTQRHILMAGCAEDNYSYEGRFDRVVQGAFTWNFCDLARKRPKKPWSDIERRVNNRLRNQGFFQEAQLVTMESNFNLALFGM